MVLKEIPASTPGPTEVLLEVEGLNFADYLTRLGGYLRHLCGAPEKVKAFGGVEVLLDARGSHLDGRLSLLNPWGRLVSIGAAQG
ncbi:MAG: hypothetical protein ACK4G4_11080 [Thermus sp.]|uniref:hypothetical protein n=1 Tax=Thermus sp. TaxID=275 RepID=UPI00391BD94A